MKKVDLYVESASDYSISMIGSDRIIKTITPEEARKLWAAGRVKDFNLAFQRLAQQFDFDIEALKAYFQRKPPQWNPKGGITQGL